MFKIKKTFTVDYAHKLELAYESKCNNIHGHTGIITIELSSDTLNNSDMVLDFTHLKPLIEDIKEKFDHVLIQSNSNDFSGIKTGRITRIDCDQSTAENIAKYIYHMTKQYILNTNISFIKSIEISFAETPTNIATYSGDV
jgi:6-pyruvoyltetrahydropterin/6-carboxytetrahydropterin synthase